MGVLCLMLACAGCEQLRVWEAPPGAPAETEPSETPEAEPETEAEPPAEPAGPELTPAEAAEVERLLDQADRAIDEDHLTYPSRGSALALYDRVAILDPDNERMKRGRERIVERYLELARSASQRGRFPQAQAMLDRAGLVDPGHPGITPMAYRIEMLSKADRQVIELDGERLRDHDPALGETLRRAGIASREDGCRAQITARSDSEGRWIYQQMSGAPGSARIRAQLDIGSPPHIEILCFPESESQ